jgi:NDP-sugar pyrophosphorylase family protein
MQPYPMDESTRAVILCGGLGTRLRPVVADRPKSMATVAGVPFLQILIERLRSQNVRDITLGTGYMAGSIESHFATGHELGVHLHYSQENEPLGTGGAVRYAADRLSDPALVLNGDSYTEWNLGAMQALMVAKNADIIMALHRVEEVSRYGNVVIENDNRVTQFDEKGSCTGPGLINAGVYLLRKQIILDLPAGTALSLERDVFPSLLDHHVYGWIAEGSFIDIGVPEDLRRAQTLLLRQAHSASSTRRNPPSD